MTRTGVTFWAVFSGLAVCAAAAAVAEPLTKPFSVQIGGQSAELNADGRTAAVAVPVQPGAELNFGHRGLVIARVVACDSAGRPTPGRKALMIVAQEGRGSLSDTLNREPLPPGRYLLSAAAGGQSAEVVFRIKAATGNSTLSESALRQRPRR